MRIAIFICLASLFPVQGADVFSPEQSAEISRIVDEKVSKINWKDKIEDQLTPELIEEKLTSELLEKKLTGGDFIEKHLLPKLSEKLPGLIQNLTRDYLRKYNISTEDWEHDWKKAFKDTFGYSVEVVVVIIIIAMALPAVIVTLLILCVCKCCCCCCGKGGRAPVAPLPPALDPISVPLTVPPLIA